MKQMFNIKTKNILIVVLLVFFVVSLTASAASAGKDAQDLKITDKNLEALNQGKWAVYDGTPYPSKLLVYGSANLDVPSKCQSLKKVGSIDALSMTDYNGKKRGQCVSFVKALSHSTKSAGGDWIRGRNVVSSGNVEPGTVIATFSDGKYINTPGKSHAAIFREYIHDSNGNIIGFRVWDQNYVKERIVGRHDIKSGTGYTGNAANYYVVQV